MLSALLLATQITTVAASSEPLVLGPEEPLGRPTAGEGEPVPRIAEPNEPTQFSLRLQHGAGAGEELIGNASASAHWWFDEHVAVGVRYNLVGVVWAGEQEISLQSGSVALSWRSSATRSHAFASVWGGVGKWEHKDFYTDESTSGPSAHLGAEAGWLWRFAFLEVGPALRGEIFKFETSRQALSFNFVAGMSF